MYPGSLSRTLDKLPGPLLATVTAIAYLLLAQYVLWLNDPVNLGAGFWPAAGVSLGLLLITPQRRWPWVILGVAVAEAGGDALHGYPAGGILFWTLGNCIEPVAGALVCRKMGLRSYLTPLRNLILFVTGAVLLGPLVGASVGSLGTIVFLDSAASQVWPKYLVGDALGVLVMAPPILASAMAVTERSMVEKLSLTLSVAAVSLVAFRNWDVVWDVALPFLVLPVLMWAALRFGAVGAALSAVSVAHVANWATAHGYGPFALPGETEHAITLMQIFLAISILTVFCLAALTSDLVHRRVIGEQLEERNRALSEALEEVQMSHLYIRKLEGILPICMGCGSVRSDDDSVWVSLDSYLMEADAVSLSHTYCPTCESEAAGTARSRAVD